MENSKFTSVFKILKEINFNSENSISSDVLCIVCNKILINAHYGPCGCRYCLECITAYQDGEDKYCPGNTDDCKIDLLNINSNIHTDHPMNVKISRLMVKCPDRQCHERVELKKMEDHIRVCNWRPSDCPFSNVGCRNVQMTNENVKQHILSENHEHMKLLMDSINILRNEVGQMKEEMRDMREEMREIRELKAEIREMKAEMGVMREEVMKKQIVIDELQAVTKQQSYEIDLLSEEIVALANVNRRMKDEINGLDTKIESYKAANLETRNNEETQICDITAQMNEKLEKMELKGSNVDVKIEGLEERVLAMADHQRQMNYGELVWPIDNFSSKRQKAQNDIETRICSESFFSHKNGYKMCLSADPDGHGLGKGTHLGVFMNLKRGPFDDILQWPFNFDVTFAIINQKSRLNHIAKTVNYNSPVKSDWENPKKDLICIGGYYDFIKLDQLISNNSLYNNDRIFLKCTVRIF